MTLLECRFIPTARVFFNSAKFFIFFVVVFSAYWAAPSQKLKVLVLLAASYWFYMSWNAKLAAVVAGSSLVDYYIGRALEHSADKR